ncbi:MAG: hypothetical protein M2R45_03628 [Verrucomicrobia subdivision 3 bacterium]|nr:hypothetical protein [Limisphaerales bacterium]MCS1416876.1 hypothetical protein [Limisphaerales bacterium]
MKYLSRTTEALDNSTLWTQEATAEDALIATRHAARITPEEQLQAWINSGIGKTEIAKE